MKRTTSILTTLVVIIGIVAISATVRKTIVHRDFVVVGEVGESD